MELETETKSSMIMKKRYLINLILLITITLGAVMRIDAQVIKTVAGGNGPVGMMIPHNITIDISGNIYAADAINSRIRMISSTGIVTTLAGSSNISNQLLGCVTTGQYGYNGDNISSITALLNKPAGVAIDQSGNIYISDALNHRIRKIDNVGIIKTIAGTGTAGYNGDNIPAISARINNPAGIFVDTSGTVYFADKGNHRVRMISVSGVITTIAGDGTPAYNGDNIPAINAELNYPSNVFKNTHGIYITDRNNNRIRFINGGNIITTVVGTGSPGYTGDNGPATSATLNAPAGIITNSSGALFIADYGNNCIRKVDNLGMISTIAGDGTANNTGDGGLAIHGTLNGPIDICIGSSGTLYIADSGNLRIRSISSSGIIDTYAGNGTDYKNGDNGPSTASNACAIGAVATDALGNQYFSEPQNNIIRKINTAGIITTIAGTGTAGFSGDSGPATLATLNNPEGIDVDAAGNIYIADKNNHRIRKIDIFGTINTIAGTTNGYSGDGGPAINSRLNYPTGITVDQSGNIYIADNGNNAIRMIDNATGDINTIAGDGTGNAGYTGDNGPATNATLNSPYKVVIDNSTNNIYISDAANNCIRQMHLGGNITTFAGTGSAGYNGDGITAISAKLNNPLGISFDDSGNLYISDSGNHRIRMVNTSGMISTTAGTGIGGYNGDGISPATAQLYAPHDISVAASGILYISDMLNGRLRSICTGGNTTASISIAANTGDTICLGTSVTFTATATGGGSSPTYQWKKNNANVGSNSNTYIANNLANNDVITCVFTSNDPCATSSVVNSNTITMTVNPTGSTTLSISTPNTTVCSGTSVTLTATSNLPGASYQWKVNGTNVGTNSSIYTYIPANGDQIQCTVTAPTGSCFTPNTLTSNTINMIVNTTITTAISIATPNTTLCAGVSATFTATTNVTGGTYQWQVNGGNQGTNSSTFTYTPTNGDLVTCNITTPSGSTCYTSNSLLSNTVSMSVIANTTATLNISTPLTTLCAGISATYSATSNVSGGTYQWKVNGTNVGINSSSYSYTPVNGDIITCVVTSSTGTCYTPSTITSNSIIMTINPVITPTISISTPNTTICSGASATFTATTNIVGGTYQWKVNGSNVGANSNNYTYTPANNDQITCTITTPTGCYSTGSTGSNVIVMTITPNTTPTVSIATTFTTICFGTGATFTATTNIMGATYQWKVNGTNMGTNSSTYTYTPVNGDQVSCVITTPASGCYTTTSATSNTITITVNPYTTPTITISSPTNTICVGTVVTFTATTNIVGGAYQWKVNGTNVGPNSNSYNYIPANGDIVTCTITTPAGCYSPTTATSNSITMTVSSSIAPTISISGLNAACSNTPVTYTATTNVIGGTIQWKVNSLNVGTNSSTYSYTPLNGDVISCVITTPVSGCYTLSNATSNTITVTVTPNVTPSISISGNNPVCVGTPVTYSSTTNIAGPTYQWSVNSANVGTNTDTYTFTPINTDNVSCTITTPSGCFSPTVVTSNTITMTVNPIIVPTITISGPTSATVGSNVIMTAIVTNAGSNYIITWKINGVFNSNTSIPTLNFTKSSVSDTVTATVASQNPGCYDTSLVSNQHIVLVDMGVNNTTLLNKITVHPNPFNETILVSGLTTSDKLCLYDLLGRKISPEWTSTSSNADQTFIINNLAPGNYVLTIRDSNGIYKENILLQKQ